MLRTVKKIIRPKPTTDGDGVNLNRVFGYSETHLTDPFLMMDHFGNKDPNIKMAGFPWHPHRGIETITYMLEGGILHEDSLGNSGKLKSGDVQLMTAGSGIIHQEMGLPESGNIYEGFQLWSNLPSKNKMMPPRYQDISSNKIPVVISKNGSNIKVITGEYEGVVGPVKGIITDPKYLDVEMPKGVVETFSIDGDKNLLIYIFRGDGFINGGETKDTVGTNTLLLFNEGNRLEIQAGDNGIRFLLLAGKPINETIAWYGPIVMNTEEELQIALKEYNDGTFTK